MQIGKRVQRLKHARLAANREMIKRRTKKHDNANERMGTTRKLDARYEVPNTQNDPTNIYTFVREYRNDPVIMVCPNLPLNYQIVE